MSVHPHDPYRQHGQPPPGPWPNQPPSHPAGQPAPGRYPPPAYPVAHQQPYPQQQLQPYGPPGPQVQHTVTNAGLPIWMHLCYGLLGWIPCFIGWVIWPIHWWFAKSKATSSTTTVYQQPYPPQQPYQPPPGYGPPHV